MIEGYKRIDEILKPGEVTWTWCSRHMDRTSHVYTGNKLICIECNPDWEQKLAEEKKGKRK